MPAKGVAADLPPLLDESMARRVFAEGCKLQQSLGGGPAGIFTSGDIAQCWRGALHSALQSAGCTEPEVAGVFSHAQRSYCHRIKNDSETHLSASTLLRSAAFVHERFPITLVDFLQGVAVQQPQCMGVTQSVHKHGSHHALRSAKTLGHEGGKLCITGATVKVPVGCVTEDVDFSVANINAVSTHTTGRHLLATNAATHTPKPYPALPRAYSQPTGLVLDGACGGSQGRACRTRSSHLLCNVGAAAARCGISQASDTATRRLRRQQRKHEQL